MTRASALYTGTVRHRRRTPVRHRFRVGVFMLYLDLEELPHLFDDYLLWSVERPNVAAFRRRDYLGPVDLPLEEAVRRRVEAATGRRPGGPIRLLTHLRYFGYTFSPVSFYYCFDEKAECVETIIAEVTNTPWKERHAYVMDRTADEGRRGLRRFRFPKAFHVSPFNGMDLGYDLRFSDPGDSLYVHMVLSREGRPFFDAGLRLRRREIGTGSLAGALAGHPFMTARISSAIYWQALRLRLKGARYYPHPAPPGGRGDE